MLFFAKNITCHWTDTDESATHSLYTALCSHPVLILPDFTKPIHIESDTSETAVGGILTQEHASVHIPIAFLSNTLTSSEKNYSVYYHELLVIVACCKAWHPYIDGQ